MKPTVGMVGMKVYLVVLANPDLVHRWKVEQRTVLRTMSRTFKLDKPFSTAAVPNSQPWGGGLIKHTCLNRTLFLTPRAALAAFAQHHREDITRLERRHKLALEAIDWAQSSGVEG